MTDGDALFRAILADPDDDTPRLVFADWLDENDEAERAELIRVQIELARHTGPPPLHLVAREKTALARHAAEWIAPLKAAGAPLEGSGNTGLFRRGFIEVVWMSADRFVERGEDLLRRTPVRELRVTSASPPSFARLLASPHFPRLDTLDLTLRGLGGDDAVGVLARCREATRLRGLRIRASNVTDAGAYRLADVEFDWPLRELDVSLNAIGPGGLAALRRRYGEGVVRCDKR